MSDEANGATREPRGYVVLVPALRSSDNVATAAPQIGAWKVLGTVTAISRRQAKEKAQAEWATELTPTPTRAVEVKLVPDRYWSTAKGTAEQVPAPPPKEAWVGL